MLGTPKSDSTFGASIGDQKETVIKIKDEDDSEFHVNCSLYYVAANGKMALLPFSVCFNSFRSTRYQVFQKNCQVFYFYVLNLHPFNLFWTHHWLCLLWTNGKTNCLVYFHSVHCSIMCCFHKNIINLTKLKESWMPWVEFTKRKKKEKEHNIIDNAVKRTPYKL